MHQSICLTVIIQRNDIAACLDNSSKPRAMNKDNGIGTWLCMPRLGPKDSLEMEDKSPNIAVSYLPRSLFEGSDLQGVAIITRKCSIVGATEHADAACCSRLAMGDENYEFSHCDTHHHSTKSQSPLFRSRDEEFVGMPLHPQIDAWLGQGWVLTNTIQYYGVNKGTRPDRTASEIRNDTHQSCCEPLWKSTEFISLHLPDCCRYPNPGDGLRRHFGDYTDSTVHRGQIAGTLISNPIEDRSCPVLVFRKLQLSLLTTGHKILYRAYAI
ncbi:hypothetical protein DL98DRAFT_588486 [Cadophora sp. DSE1049]|nr:hypothetical protein DL98DRAFT_588486 [Cadophora sp. DSE1049]